VPGKLPNFIPGLSRRPAASSRVFFYPAAVTNTHKRGLQGMGARTLITAAERAASVPPPDLARRNPDATQTKRQFVRWLFSAYLVHSLGLPYETVELAEEIYS
jgi:hypothetical protein